VERDGGIKAEKKKLTENCKQGSCCHGPRAQCRPGKIQKRNEGQAMFAHKRRTLSERGNNPDDVKHP